MATEHGDFVWYELATGDLAGADRFYSGLMGWQFKGPEPGEPDYSVFTANGMGICGILQLTDDMRDKGAQPLWSAYIAVDDVDETASAIKQAGGNIILEPWDIPDVGRVALATDPSGALFYIMNYSTSMESESFAVNEPKIGHGAWNELATSDPAGARDFYSKIFGWAHTDSMDMGPMGAYDMYKKSADAEFLICGMMQKPDEMPASLWAHYFRVASVNKAVDYINANGGQVLAGPMPIPGDEFSVTGIDPQGAVFNLVGAE